MFKIAFIQVSFLQFFCCILSKLHFFTVGFQCKNYSEITVETRTQLKSLIFTTDIFAVQTIGHNFIRLRILLAADVSRIRESV